MKYSFLKKGIAPFLFIFLSAFMFSSCLKKDATNGTQQPAAGLMAFNLATPKNSVGFAVSGNVITYSPLSFTNYTGGYVNLFPGSRTVESFDFGVNNVIDSSSINFEQGKYYSVFLVGDTSHYQNILVQDNFDSLTYVTNTSYIRYVNAMPSVNNPLIKITDGTTDVFSGTAAFKTVSTFKPITAGSISITASSESGLSVSRSITLEAGKAYTILLVGDPNATDPSRQVQIKYVYNVNITP